MKSEDAIRIIEENAHKEWDEVYQMLCIKELLDEKRKKQTKYPPFLVELKPVVFSEVKKNE